MRKVCDEQKRRRIEERERKAVERRDFLVRTEVLWALIHRDIAKAEWERLGKTGL